MGFINHIKEEFQVIRERDPAIKTPLEVLLYPSFRVMIQYRRAHKLYEKGHFFLARWVSQRAARKTGIVMRIPFLVIFMFFPLYCANTLTTNTFCVCCQGIFY